MVGGSPNHRGIVGDESWSDIAKISDKDEALLYEVFVPVPFCGAVRSVKGPEERSGNNRRTALDSAPGSQHSTCALTMPTSL
jgi:hypothetical protein